MMVLSACPSTILLHSLQLSFMLHSSLHFSSTSLIVYSSKGSIWYHPWSICWLQRFNHQLPVIPILSSCIKPANPPSLPPCTYSPIPDGVLGVNDFPQLVPNAALHTAGPTRSRRIRRTVLYADTKIVLAHAVFRNQMGSICTHQTSMEVAGWKRFTSFDDIFFAQCITECSPDESMLNAALTPET